MKTKIKRNRAIKSCYFCYTHKHQCNKSKPKCNLCLKYKQSNCVYGFNKYIEEQDESPIRSKKSDSGRIISNAFYPYFDDFSNINFLTEGENSLTMPSRYYFSFLDLSYTSKFTLAHILRLLPNKRDCKKMVRQYFSSIHPILPILDAENTSKDIDTLLNRSDDENVDLNTLLILFAMLFSVSLSSEIYGEYKQSPTHIDLRVKYEFLGSIEYLKQRLRFPSDPTLACIESSLIVYTVGSTNYKDLSAQLAALVRSSEILGLHRDPSKLHIDTNSILVEPERRKLLWHLIMQAECMSSINCGLSSLASKVDYDTDCPTYFENQVTNPSLAFSVARFKASLLISKLLDILNGTLKPNSALVSELFEQVLNLYNECNTINNDILYHLNNDPYGVWLTANIIVYVHRCYLLWERINYSLSKSLSKMKIVTTKGVSSTFTQDSLLKNLLKPASVDSMGLKVAVLLLYATSERITINIHTEKFLWYIRHCQPFQYLLILLRDLNSEPKRIIEFHDTSMPQAIARYVPDYIRVQTDVDHRVLVTNKVISKLEIIKEFWPESVQKRFELIKVLRDHVFQKLNIQDNDHKSEFSFEFEELFGGSSGLFTLPSFTLDDDFYNITW